MLTKEEISQALPAHLNISVTDELVTKVNQASSDPDEARNIRENFISYTRVLKEGRFKLEDYINAVTYASYKIAGYTSKEAYQRTFPQRYAGLMARGLEQKDIAAHIAAYNKNKLVNLILEQSLIPTWVLNQDAYQEAINVQVQLMQTAKSEKVRSDAANSILTHLKPPETSKVELSIGEHETEGMRDLKEALGALAKQQQQLITSGMPTSQVAKHKLIDVTPKDVTPIIPVTPAAEEDHL